MVILRIILVITVVWLVISLYRRLRRKLISVRGVPDSNNIRKMVRCAFCDLHIPSDEAVLDDGTYYCCHQHQVKMNQGKQK